MGAPRARMPSRQLLQKWNRWRVERLPTSAMFQKHGRTALSVAHHAAVNVPEIRSVATRRCPPHTAWKHKCRSTGKSRSPGSRGSNAVLLALLFGGYGEKNVALEVSVGAGYHGFARDMRVENALIMQCNISATVRSIRNEHRRAFRPWRPACLFGTTATCSGLAWILMPASTND